MADMYCAAAVQQKQICMQKIFTSADLDRPAYHEVGSGVVCVCGRKCRTFSIRRCGLQSFRKQAWRCSSSIEKDYKELDVCIYSCKLSMQLRLSRTDSSETHLQMQPPVAIAGEPSCRAANSYRIVMYLALSPRESLIWLVGHRSL